MRDGIATLFTPFKLGQLTLRNRFVQTAHEPAYGEGGAIKERYERYVEEKAKGQVGLIMFGGSAMVSSAWSPSFGQLNVADDSVIPAFRSLAARIKPYGSGLICQLSHPGRRSRYDSRNWIAPIAPGYPREPEHRALPKLIEDHEIEMILRDFGLAARRCQEGGLDGVEVVFQAGQLINNFLSPDTNQRGDQWGGALENRLHFGLEALRSIRAQIGNDWIVGVRMIGDEMIDDGMDQQECLEVAIALAESGLVTYLSVVGVRAGGLHSGAANIPNMSFGSAPYLYLPSAIRARVAVPIIHAQRIADPQTAARAIADGHVDLIAMNRAFLADPHFVRKLAEGRQDDIRLCVGANYCIDRIYAGGDALCIQNAATGRETTIPHVLSRAPQAKRVVVVGGGPGGLEAARVAAERGHRVVLFEAAERVGGQINLAAKATWRAPLGQIVTWLESQVRKHGGEIRLGRRATAQDVLNENPDLVVLATGGLPFKPAIDGADLAGTTWDMLAGRVDVAANALVYDEHGGHQALSCAEFAAKRGAMVEYVTPYRSAGAELGLTNFPTHLRELHKADAVISTNLRLTRVYREGNRLVAVLRHEYSFKSEERLVDQIVVECGTQPAEDELYQSLKPLSINAGQVDLDALRINGPQTRVVNPAGKFRLLRVGDAVSGRNIHAAIYDSIRLTKDF